MTNDTLTRLTKELRALRSGWGRQGDTPSSPGAWSAAQYAYDEALVLAADLLKVPDAPEPEFVVGRRRLTEPERARLELGLAERGVDVGVTRSLPRPTKPMLALASGGPEADAPPGPDPGQAGRAPPPPPRSEAGTTDEARHARRERSGRRRTRPASELWVGRLAADARTLRRRLAEYRSTSETWPTKVADWTADLDAYDELLVTIAEMVGVPSPVPDGARRRLLLEDRVRLEEQLAEAGLDVRRAD